MPYEFEDDARFEFEDTPKESPAFSFEPAPATEPEVGYFGNIIRKIGERTSELAGQFAAGAEVNTRSIDEAFTGGLVWDQDSVIPRYAGPDELRQLRASGQTQNIADAAKGTDFGAEDRHTWDEVKRHFREEGAASGMAEVLKYAGETGGASVPDMAAAIINLPTYIFARTAEIGETRAKNKGKDKTTLIDMMEAAPFAIGSAILERIGGKGIVGIGDEAIEKVGKGALKEIAKRAGSAATKEAGTEFIQEGIIEYVGEKFGTNAQMNMAEATERGLAAAVAGGTYGGGTAAGVQAADVSVKAASQANVRRQEAADAGADPLDQELAAADGLAEDLSIDVLDADVTRQVMPAVEAEALEREARATPAPITETKFEGPGAEQARTIFDEKQAALREQLEPAAPTPEKTTAEVLAEADQTGLPLAEVPTLTDEVTAAPAARTEITFDARASEAEINKFIADRPDKEFERTKNEDGSTTLVREVPARAAVQPAGFEFEKEVAPEVEALAAPVEAVEAPAPPVEAPVEKPAMAERRERKELDKQVKEAATQALEKQVEAAAAQAQTSPDNALPEPTEAQIEAGVYKKGHVTIAGLDISIENPKGSTRRGIAPDGKTWKTTLKDHYGYIKRTLGADGDHVDVFIGPNVESDKVYVVDQVNPKTGKFDEHKVIIGAKTEKQARIIYKRNYVKGWKGERAITEMTQDEFKTWLKEGDQTKAIKSKGIDKPPAPPKEPSAPPPPAPPSDPSDYSASFSSLGGAGVPLWTRVKKALRRELLPEGLLPKSVFKEKLARDFELNGAEFDVANRLGHFDQAVRTGYGVRYTKLLDAEKSLINEALAGAVPADSIPTEVREELLKMRAGINKLSEQYAQILAAEAVELAESGKDEQAIAKAELLKTIANNMDTYVHRSYKAFDDPKWPTKVPKEVYDAAAAYLEKALSKGKPVTTEIREQVAATIELLLQEGTAYDNLPSMLKESKLGAKDLSVLKRRKEIAPEVRALLGEYVDPKINYTKTITKMSRLVMNQQFLTKVREIGMDEGFLFTKSNRALGATRKIAGAQAESYAPLNGLYTFPEIDQAFRDALGKEQMADWVRTIIRLNGMVKYGKTVLSPTTAARNWISASLFTMANGHFNLLHTKKSMESIREYFTHGEGKDGYLKKLKRLGVVYDTPYAGEMMDLLADSQLEHSLFNKKPFTNIRKMNDIAQKFYQYGDDFWKIIGFENEKTNMMKYYNLSEADAEVKAAERIRNTYPTYSLTGRAVRRLRRFPLAGTFVSFPAEIIRTSYHIVRYAKEDMAKSKSLGAQRIAGLAIASGMMFGLQKLSMAMLGMAEEDDDAVRTLAAPWQKNANLFYLGADETGSMRFIDMSFADPYNYWKRPLNAIMRDQPMDDKLIEAAKEVLLPFFGTDLAFGAITEAITNEKASGGRIFNPEASPLKQTADIAHHLRKALQPGIMSNIERMTKAVSKERSASGAQYSIDEEMLSWIGLRKGTLNPKVSVYYRAFGFNERRRNATQLFSSVSKNLNKVSDEDLLDAYETAAQAHLDAYEEMAEVVSASMRLGVSKTQMRTLLKGVGISTRDRTNLVNGRAVEWNPSNQTMVNAVKKARRLHGAGEVVDRLETRRNRIRKLFK